MSPSVCADTTSATGVRGNALQRPAYAPPRRPATCTVAVDATGKDEMRAERRLALLQRMNRDGSITTARLCEVASEITGLPGAGIMLMVDGVLQGSICSSDPVAARIEQLQLELGEGPCVDACREERPVTEPDLAGTAIRRWIAFGPPAVDAGVRAVFAFPMQIGTVHLGALDLWSDRAGPLTDAQHDDAVLLTSISAQALLAMQAGALPDQLAAEMEVGTDFRYVVHQASGMVAAQLQTTIATALVRLRARAYAEGRSLDDVAADVVGRIVRFTDDDDDNDATLAPS
jgi:hypothetical protein